MKHKIQKFNLYIYIAILTMTLFLALSAQAQTAESQISISSGGTFTLEKTVVAGGGNQVTTAPLNKSGTIGQSIAGYKSTGRNFTLYSGFWTPDALAPTAAGVVVGGRIKTLGGKGIRNVIITITFPTGEQRTTVSGAFGYYRFAEIPAGETYIFSVSARRYTFSSATQIRNILEDTQDIDFIGDMMTLSSEIPSP
ncbi:MAG TPA: carboxypeptidase-like regulatory domain-containing protein [Pyrinomonadaceae bacterium]|nr:carboxypeptidase-like regulatory domain-containing protein [Pyrinomonadaceae bacterium]